MNSSSCNRLYAPAMCIVTVFNSPGVSTGSGILQKPKGQSNIIFRGLGVKRIKKKIPESGARSCDDGMEVQEAALAIEAACSKAKKKGKHSKYLPALPFS